MSAVQRNGNVIARVIANTDGDTVRSFVRKAISNKVSLISTDEARSYKVLDGNLRHGSVDHADGRYICGAVHTNTIEGFWSIVKFWIMGTFHKVTPKFLPLYVNEFEFRYNNRMNADIFGAAIIAC